MNPRPMCIERHADWESTQYLYLVLQELEKLNRNLARALSPREQPAALAAVPSPSPLPAPASSTRERQPVACTQADGYVAEEVTWR
jgi:hypothetical protein